MTRSRRQAENGLILGYKKAEEVARKKVVHECATVLYRLATPFAWSVGMVN